MKKETVKAIVTTLCGTEAGNKDGDAKVAQFRTPYSFCFSNNNNNNNKKNSNSSNNNHKVMYVADATNHCIRTVTFNPEGSIIVGTLCGSPGSNNFKDGPKKEALFNGPYGITIDSKGQNLYVADTMGNSIRKISLLPDI